MLDFAPTSVGNIFCLLFQNEKHFESPPDVQAEEVVQEAAPALVALLRTRRLPDAAASAPRDGSVAPEEVEAQVRNVGGPLGDACALYHEDG